MNLDVMKRCPQCNRVENDDSLVFCRADGAELVNSSELSGEIGTAKLGPSSGPTEIETSILPHLTNAGVSRGTGPTTVLAATFGHYWLPAQAETAKDCDSDCHNCHGVQCCDLRSCR